MVQGGSGVIFHKVSVDELESYTKWKYHIMFMQGPRICDYEMRLQKK